jgi:hypothetical protein
MDEKTMILGQSVEEMILTDGWKHVEAWIQRQKKQAANDLQTKEFKELTAVKALQAKIKALCELEAEIQHRINRGREARRKAERQE